MVNEQIPLEIEYRNGIYIDLFWAQYHYFIFRTIGENHGQIEKIPELYERHIFGSIQQGSWLAAILSLAKFYDSPHKKYNVSCLKNFLESCKGAECQDFPLNTENEIYDDFNPYLAILKIESLTQIKRPSITFSKPFDFINYLESTLSSGFVTRRLKNIRIARDKFIAHNEIGSGIKSIDALWDDFADLVFIGRLYAHLLEEVFLSTHYEIWYPDSVNHVSLNILSNAKWLFEKMSKHIDPKRQVVWWT